MNEEISKVLQMLEAGKVSAEEAERLIRAIKEEGPRPGGTAGTAGAAAEAPPRPSPCRDLADLLRGLERAARRAALRKRREYWWHWYRLAAREEASRRQRAATQSVFDRVRFTLTERVMLDPNGLGPSSRLAEDLGMDPMGWDVLGWALKEEFGFTAPASDLHNLATVQALVDYVAGRVTPPAGAPPGGGQAQAAAPEPPLATPDTQGPPAEAV